MEEDILLPGRLNLPHATAGALEPDFYLSSTKKHQKPLAAKPKKLDLPSDITLDWQAKLIFDKWVKRVHDLVHCGPNSTILHVELIQPFDPNTPVTDCIAKIFKPAEDKFNRKVSKHEFSILRRMQAAGIRVPTVYACSKHVMFMSIIESPHNHLQYLRSTEEQEAEVYKQIVEMMTLLYRKAKLVHTDVSRINFLVDDKSNCWILDVGTAIERSQPEALGALLVDCQKITKVKLFPIIGI